MKNPFKQSNSMMAFNNWGSINDNHLGYIFISDNNTGIDLYCCTQHHARIVQIIQD